MSSSSADARNTGDGAAGAPGLGAGLVAGVGGDGVRLAVVLPHVGVHELDHVRANRDLEDGWEDHALRALLALIGEDCHKRPGRLEKL